MKRSLAVIAALWAGGCYGGTLEEHVLQGTAAPRIGCASRDDVIIVRITRSGSRAATFVARCVGSQTFWQCSNQPLFNPVTCQIVDPPSDLSEHIDFGKRSSFLGGPQ
jgi:hypothetical protein